MNSHYTDYVNKSIPASEVTFEHFKPEDKALIGDIRKQHIKFNKGLLIPDALAFLLCLAGFGVCVANRHRSLFVDIITIAVFFIGVALTGYVLWSILGPVRKIRKGVVISSERIYEKKDDRNGRYLYVFDIYMEDIDRTLMSLQVKKEVYQDITPGDGVIIFRPLKSIKVLADPSRKGVMDVSKIKSGVDYKLDRRE